MRGCHRVGATTDKTGKVLTESKTLTKGTIFESDTNLSELYPEKFRDISNGIPRTDILSSMSDDALEEELNRRKDLKSEPVSLSEDDRNLQKELDAMSFVDLQSYAKELEVVISDEDTKSEIVENIISSVTVTE